MIEGILPDGVAVATRLDDAPGEKLFAEEEAEVARAVEKRRKEFRAGRACARSALAQLGMPAQPIPTGSRGAPLWPTGIVGSITHCDGFRACAVGRRVDFATIGIDAEVNAALPEALLPDIALPQERARLEILAADDRGVRWDRLLFSAKESVYKAWFPLAERWLGFEDADVTIDRDSGAFSARLLVRGPRLLGGELTGFVGRWQVSEGVLSTAIALPAMAAR